MLTKKLDQWIMRRLIVDGRRMRKGKREEGESWNVSVLPI